MEREAAETTHSIDVDTWAASILCLMHASGRCNLCTRFPKRPRLLEYYPVFNVPAAQRESNLEQD